MIKVHSVLKNNTRIYLTDATELAQKTIDIHKTNPLASLSLSTAVSVYSVYFKLKHEMPTSVSINGNGPLGRIILETNGMDSFKALVVNPDVVTEYDDSKFNEIPIPLGIGDAGTLKIIHSVADTNFGGEVKLANADITTDLAYYLDQSEQIHSAVVSSVVLETKSKLKHAKAVIFQMLPGYKEEDIKWVEEFIKTNSLSDLSIDNYIKNMDGKLLETYEMDWKCNCSKEKMLNAAKTISKEDIASLIEKNGSVEVGCDFCLKKFQFEDKDFNV